MQADKTHASPRQRRTSVSFLGPLSDSLNSLPLAQTSLHDKEHVQQRQSLSTRGSIGNLQLNRTNGIQTRSLDGIIPEDAEMHRIQRNHGQSEDTITFSKLRLDEGIASWQPSDDNLNSCLTHRCQLARPQSSLKKIKATIGQNQCHSTKNNKQGRPSSSLLVRMPNRLDIKSKAPPTIDFQYERVHSQQHTINMYTPLGVGRHTGVAWEARTLTASRCNGVVEGPQNKVRPRRYRVLSPNEQNGVNTSTVVTVHQTTSSRVSAMTNSSYYPTCFAHLLTGGASEERDSVWTVIEKGKRYPLDLSGFRAMPTASTPTRFSASMNAWTHSSMHLIKAAPGSPGYIDEAVQTDRPF